MPKAIRTEPLHREDQPGDSQKPLGPEAQKLLDRFGAALLPLTNGMGIDVGHGKAYRPWPNCIGLEVGHPGYDGVRIPYPNGHFDFAISSHVIEHVEDPIEHLRELFRVVLPGGHVILHVPHRDLYEKSFAPPSRFNLDHKRFYTPARLLEQIERSYLINSYRIRAMMDLDAGFDYTIPPDQHSGGHYSILCCVEKLDHGPSGGPAFQ